MKQHLKIILVIVLFALPIKSFSWGKKGHAIIAEIAFTHLNETSKNILLKYLDGLPIEDAANWMDNMRNDHSYDFMEPYHYAYFEKGYKARYIDDDHIISIVTKTIKELENHETYSKDKIKIKLCYLIHLLGDLHQPLNVGYDTDKGGNSFQVNFNGKETDLHSLVGNNIILYKNISLQDCLQSTTYDNIQLQKNIKKDIVAWANQSRSYLDEIYNLNGNEVDTEYAEKKSIIIKNQLHIAGIRLARVLNEILK